MCLHVTEITQLQVKLKAASSKLDERESEVALVHFVVYVAAIVIVSATVRNRRVG